MKQILYENLVQYIVENQNRFYRIAYSYTKHQDDALDAVQAAVCKALESYEAIKNELNKLEPDVQGIIRLKYFEGLSLKEISYITGINLNTVKTKLYRGLKLLKENIQEADLWEN